MKILSISLDNIMYRSCEYDDTLYKSLLRMGQGFPILVRRIGEHQYICLDGHKRLSAIHDICIEQPNTKLRQINVILENARSCSGTTKNHH